MVVVRRGDRRHGRGQPGPDRAALARRRPATSTLASDQGVRAEQPAGGPARRYGGDPHRTPLGDIPAHGSAPNLARPPLPPRRHLRRRGDQLQRLQRAGRAGRAVPVRRRRHRGAGRAGREDGVLLARLPPRHRRRASATATGCTAPGIRRNGLRSQPGQAAASIRTPRRSRARCGGTRRVFGHLHADPMARNDADSAPFMPKSVVVNPYFDWENDRPLRVPVEESVIYEVHVKGATARHPDIEPELRGRYGGLGPPGVHPAPARPRRHHGRAAAGAPVRPRQPPRRAGPAQLLGLQLDRVPRAPQRLRPPPDAASRCRSSARW